jgi:hypothetical protein
VREEKAGRGGARWEKAVCVRERVLFQAQRKDVHYLVEVLFGSQKSKDTYVYRHIISMHIWTRVSIHTYMHAKYDVRICIRNPHEITHTHTHTHTHGQQSGEFLCGQDLFF